MRMPKNLGWKLLSLAIAVALWIIAAREPEDALGQQVHQRVRDVAGRAWVYRGHDPCPGLRGTHFQRVARWSQARVKSCSADASRMRVKPFAHRVRS